jgi:2-polyprenyl-3-methyl-5-hydroxy-6-metoxy-1,4-benzoquinol methylase
MTDPHKGVAVSKNNFFRHTLHLLDKYVPAEGRKILDVGCGYGYFLDRALNFGWETFGVEILEDAVKLCRGKFGFKNISSGHLHEANLGAATFEAITLWDVLAIVDNPDQEVQECYRLLKSGGVIGVRTRNAVFHQIGYRAYHALTKIASKHSIKKPYVFNKFCFTAKALQAVLSRAGFTNIRIDNSPLTYGDPYDHLKSYHILTILKKLVTIGSKVVSKISSRRLLLAPSLLVWAEKP